jgi:hypothetical protein
MVLQQVKGRAQYNTRRAVEGTFTFDQGAV